MKSRSSIPSSQETMSKISDRINFMHLISFASLSDQKYKLINFRKRAARPQYSFRLSDMIKIRSELSPIAYDNKVPSIYFFTLISIMEGVAKMWNKRQHRFLSLLFNPPIYTMFPKAFFENQVKKNGLNMETFYQSGLVEYVNKKSISMQYIRVTDFALGLLESALGNYYIH